MLKPEAILSEVGFVLSRSSICLTNVQAVANKVNELRQDQVFKRLMTVVTSCQGHIMILVLHQWHAAFKTKLTSTENLPPQLKNLMGTLWSKDKHFGFDKFINSN